MITSGEQILVCKHNSSYFHALCVGIIFNCAALGIHLCETSQLYNFITRLVEICSSNANVHKGHCTLNYKRERMDLGKLI